MIMTKLMRHKVHLMVGIVALVIVVHLVLGGNTSNKVSAPIQDALKAESKPDKPISDPEMDIAPVAEPAEPENAIGEAVVDEKIVDEEPKAPKEATMPSDPEKATALKSIRDYSVFFDDLEKYKPKFPGFKKAYKTEKAAEKFTNVDNFLFSKEYLENVLDIPDETVADLKKSHSSYVENHINKLIENYGISTFGNILKTDPEWNTYQGSKGYVLIGGGRYSWLSYLVIKQIRATGSTLPIELFIPGTGEYEEDFCEKLLPRYNARCNVFDDKLAGTLKTKYSVDGYQYKMLALLTSKFESVIYLDSDDFPVRDPEYILNSDLYQKTGLILWPDAWARTTNPKFFDIAGVTVKENKIRYNNYDRKQAEKQGIKVKPMAEYTFKDAFYHTFEGTLPDPTSETGQLIINKTKHLKTLLLALYYNVFGPNYYYPLMTQGSAGEGDKETFIAAAHVLGEPWFQTKKSFSWVGYNSKSEKKFTSKALGHFDPVKSEQTTDKLNYIFMHLSYPKYYPNWLVDNHDLVYADSKEHIRMYGSVYDNVGYDFDLRVLQFFTQGLCSNYYDEEGNAIDEQKIKAKDEYMGKYLVYVQEEEEKNKKRCSEVFIPHLKWLKETSKFPDTVVQPLQKEAA